MKRFVIIDAHAVIHRAFHALPPLTSPDGKPVQAVYGFASILLKIIREFSPNYLVAAFDAPGPTFRHVAFEHYKAERQKAPDALYEQIPLVKELLSAFHVPVLELQGYEADDIIATIVAKLRSHHPDLEIVIVTGDLDTLQLVDERTKVFTMRKGVADTIIYDDAAVRARYGLPPHKLADWKGLRGDPSDNIPGVRGIGEKSASELLQTHGSIEELFKSLRRGEVKAKPAVLEALRKSEADALFSKSLATLERHVPIRFVLAHARFKKSDILRDEVRHILERFGFKSLIVRLNGAAPAPPQTQQPRTEPMPRVSDLSSLNVLRGVERRALFVPPARNAVFVATGARDIARLPIAALAGGGWSAAQITYCCELKQLVHWGVPADHRKVRDLSILWWLTDPDRRDYSAAAIARYFSRIESADPVAIVSAMWSAAPVLEALIKKEELNHIYNEIESPMIPILAEMERIGIGFDAAPIAALKQKITKEIAALEEKIYTAAGSAFNLSSPRQLSDVLFQKLGIAERGIRKTEKGGALSTRESELEKLRRAHPIVSDILSWRALAKLKSTYVDTLPKLVGPDQRIHTVWNQTGTATGRLSSRNPNLQNIPIKSEYGREIRKAFVASRGMVLISFDYSQLELRIAADLSKDEKMIDAFRRGFDVHAMTAAETNNIPIEKVTPELRQRAKVLNFGILYGMGPRAFAEAACISQGEAEAFIEEYFHDFSGIRRFIDQTRLQAREKKFTTTAFGAKRYYPDIETSNFRLQREFERAAVNHPIQGTAAGIMKKAMIAADQYLRAGKNKERARLLLQVHDELIYEVKRSDADLLIRAIQRIMEDVWTGDVKMRVGVKRGKNWGELE